MPDEDQPGRAPVVVLSHGLWSRRFGSDPSIVGRAITIGGVARAVVGVMPNGFDLPARGTEAWIPTTIDRADTNDYIVGYLLLVARMRPGQSVDAAGKHMRAIAADLRGTSPGAYNNAFGSKTVVEPLRKPPGRGSSGSCSPRAWLSRCWAERPDSRSRGGWADSSARCFPPTFPERETSCSTGACWRSRARSR